MIRVALIVVGALIAVVLLAILVDFVCRVETFVREYGEIGGPTWKR